MPARRGPSGSRGASCVDAPAVGLRGDGVSSVRVAGVQRARLLAAAVEVASELGYKGMSTARVSRRAGVSRKTFYDHFENREDCFLAVFDEAVARATVVAQDAVSADEQLGGSGSGLGLSALLGFLGDEPGLGSLLVVDALGAGPRVLERRAQGARNLAGLSTRGAREVKTGDGPPPLTAEGVVGAVLSVIHARMLERRPGPADGSVEPVDGDDRAALSRAGRGQEGA